MNNDLISIVVPVYKVEQYIEENITSLVNQTYKNLEIILVDDGSPDDCGKIFDQFASKDNRIKVIHKENGGLSDARNYGIDRATGKYIVFVDSDDYIDNRYIEILYNAIKTNNTKISQCGVLKINDKNEVMEKLGYVDKQIKTGKEMLKDLYNGHAIENVVVWNKMYAIEMFKDLRYPVGKIHEDEFTTYKILYNIDSIAIVNEHLYYYRQNENSITGKTFNIKRLDKLEAYEQRLAFFQEKEEKELYGLTLFEYLSEIRQSYINTRKYIDNSQDILSDLIKKYRENYKYILKDKNVSFMKKVKMLIFYISPQVFNYIKKMRDARK